MKGLGLFELIAAAIVLWAIGIVGWFVRDSWRVWKRWEDSQRHR